MLFKTVAEEVFAYYRFQRYLFLCSIINLTHLYCHLLIPVVTVYQMKKLKDFLSSLNMIFKWTAAMDTTNNSTKKLEKKPGNPYHIYSQELLLQIKNPGLKIIDIGCGSCDMSVFARDVGYSVTPIDISDRDLNLARKLGFNAVKADISKPLPFGDDTFDCALMLEVIEHIPNAEKIVEEIARIVKPGGSLIMSTPNHAYYKRRIKALHGREPDDEGYHYRFFVKRKLLNLFRERSFEIDNTNSFGFLPLVDKILLRKMLKKKRLRFKIPFAFESLFADRFVWLLRNKKTH